jgi:choice-of-anchor B domain-containing protein
MLSRLVRRRGALSRAAIAALTVASVAAVSGTDLFATAEAHRGHAAKTDGLLSASANFVPTKGYGPAACVDGLAEVFECSGLDLASYTPNTAFVPTSRFAALGDQRLSDVWGWVDEETGDEYVILGQTNSAGLVRVTDPAKPEFLGRIDGEPGAQLVWYDIKVYEDHAFIVSESNPAGMKVFDLTRLRGLEADKDRVFQEDFYYPLSVAAHNIAINEDTGFAYIVGGNAGLVANDVCRAGLHMVDISTPKLPVFAGCYLTDGGGGTAAGVAGVRGPLRGVTAAYVHDTHCVVYDGPDEEHQGKEICINSSEVFVDIVDVSNKALPTQLGSVSYDTARYTHQGWLSEDHRFFFLGDEADENSGTVKGTHTYVFDVSDLDDPKLIGPYVAEFNAIDHNMYVRGELLFQSNYEAGLRVLDTAPLYDEDDARLLEEIAFFDVFPGRTTPVFSGTWSNYPYFPSGNVAVSSYTGLFMLTPSAEAPEKLLDTLLADAPTD